MAVEGVDQLETYFGAYLPQFFYAMLAPLTLFLCLSTVNIPSAVVLLVCVPLIPISIAAVQTWAKKLLSKYWDQYTGLGDTFLENLQGLTTLKIYQADDAKHRKMNEEAEKFRKITMKVLSMQLNSITIMDLVAYGGAALGVIMAVTQMHQGHVDLFGCVLIILLSADFLSCLCGLLGSFFHIAMNGMAAADKIFKLLDLPEEAPKTVRIGENCTVEVPKSPILLWDSREILHGVSMVFPEGSFTAIVGESGCGKSTITAIAYGQKQRLYRRIAVGEISLSEIKEASVMENITYVCHQSYLFKGTVRENLFMGNPAADDAKMLDVLKQVNLYRLFMYRAGLGYPLDGKRHKPLRRSVSEIGAGTCNFA